MDEHESISRLRAMGASESQLPTWQELVNGYLAGQGDPRGREIVLSAQMRILQLEAELARYEAVGLDKELEMAEFTLQCLEEEHQREQRRQGPVLRLVP